MAKIRPPFPITALILALLLLTATAPALTHALSLSQYRTLFSLSHSLLTRVSNIRAERGDISGANRVKFIAQKLDQGLGFGLGWWGFALPLGWDYVKNYAWRELDLQELYSAVSDLNELMSTLSESARVDSDTEEDRVDWVRRNYGKILAVSKRLFARLLHVFPQSVRFFNSPFLFQHNLLYAILFHLCDFNHMIL